jgi:uncharacterized membrane protein
LTNDFWRIGLLLIIIGFLIVFVAAILLVFESFSASSSSGDVSGCIILFFIPICFGAGSKGFIVPLMITALVITIIILFIILFIIWSARKSLEGYSGYGKQL